jgi:hypothetical protein
MREARTLLSSFRFIAVMLAVAVVVLAGACLLPHDRYLRFQSLTDSAVVKAGWIYERIHFDPAPIDVAFIGTSHTVFGIDSKAVEQACREAGGKTCATVNFGLQFLGRNVHWLITRELLLARKPKLLVVEVQETEFRAMHPAFGSLADALDVVSAPLVINTSFFPDLVRLPLRQMSLFAQSRAPSLFGVGTDFVPALYRGTHWDDTFAERGSARNPVVDAKPRTKVVPVAELEHERADLADESRTRLRLPARLRPLEYRANQFYLERLLDLARQKNIEIRFLYMPAYRTTAMPDFAGFYSKFGPTWLMPEEIVNNHELWLDIVHLNYAGASALSVWLGEKIANSHEPVAQSQ